MTRQSGKDKSGAPWTPCPVGELERLGQRLRNRRRRRLFLRTAGGVLTTIVVGGGLALWWGSGEPPPPGEITCAEVERLLELFVRNQLEASLQQQVRAHASECPRCRPRFQAMNLPLS